MPLHHLTRFPRLELIGAPTPLEYLPRLSDYLGREIYIKRDDVTPIAMGGNKLRKLEFLVADALRRGGYADNRRGDSVEPCPSDGGGRGQIGTTLRRLAGKSNRYHRGKLPDEW